MSLEFLLEIENNLYKMLKDVFSINRTEFLIICLCKNGYNTVYEMQKKSELDRSLIIRYVKSLESKKCIYRKDFTDDKGRDKKIINLLENSEIILEECGKLQYKIPNR